MSIASEVTRIISAKAAIKASIIAKGVTVASGVKLDGYAAKVDSIVQLDTSDATAAAGDIRNTMTAYAAGAKITGSWAPTEIDNYTKYLLHFNGSNNQTIIEDALGYGWTATGNAKLVTAQKKFGTASLYTYGDGVIYTARSSKLAFGTENFTIDFWICPVLSNAWVFLMGQYYTAGNEWRLWLNGNNGISFYWRYNGIDVAGYRSTEGYIVSNVWTHVAVVRSGTNLYIFTGGVLRACVVDTAIGSNSLSEIAAPMVLMSQITSAGSFYGYVDEFRISQGIARWTSNFTPPTSEHAR